MRIYHFSEQPCPDAWAPEHKSLRVILPSRNCDPRVMAENYHHRLDEWMLAEKEAPAAASTLSKPKKSKLKTRSSQ